MASTKDRLEAMEKKLNVRAYIYVRMYVRTSMHCVCMYVRKYVRMCACVRMCVWHTFVRM